MFSLSVVLINVYLGYVAGPHSILCISEMAHWKSLTEILSSVLPAISLALLYIALNFPILYEKPIFSNNALIWSRVLTALKSCSETPSS